MGSVIQAKDNTSSGTSSSILNTLHDWPNEAVILLTKRYKQTNYYKQTR